MVNVNIQKRKVLTKRKSSGNCEGAQSRIIEIETNLIDYGDSQVEGTNVVISVAVATFELKEEDRHTVLRLGDDKAFREFQEKLNCKPTIAAFIGVFDGHDGSLASDYCSKGLLPHIVSEHAVRCAPPTTKHSWSLSNNSVMSALDFETDEPNNNKDLELAFIGAFQKAQRRFCNHMDPPTLEEVCKKKPLKTERSKGYNPISWLGSSMPPKRGGCTACTMAILMEKHADNSHLIVPKVIVANTGDSRLITDDASGTSKYRQITTDHRPSDPMGKRRLTECVARGEAFLDRSSEYRDIRVFPGGLAVSRTIGDGCCSKSVICTPEVIHVPLNIVPSSDSNINEKQKTQRFIIGSDGLWDAMSNHAVGKAAARKGQSQSYHSSHSKQRERGDEVMSNGSSGSHNNNNKGDDLDGGNGNGAATPKEAASRIMEQCLKNGGNQDDITICVVDVTYQ